MREVAKAIAERPSLISKALAWMETHPLPPFYHELWREVLSLPPDDLAAAIVDNSERGQQRRNCAPRFGDVVADEQLRRRLARKVSRLVGRRP